MILQSGTVLRGNEALKPIEVTKLLELLTDPSTELEERIRQLRSVRLLDEKRYHELKRMLPYVVCATFSPAYRRNENFAYTESFFIDLDHVSSSGRDINTLCDKLRQDRRVMLMFVSPGGDGIKILMRLKSRCYDVGMYSTFYKLFLSKWAVEQDVADIVDTGTNDVSRACFLSVDRSAYFNVDAEAIDMAAYIDAEGLLFQEPEQEQAVLPMSPTKSVADVKAIDPDDTIMAQIRRRLAQGRERIQKQELPAPYVPERLTQLMPMLCEMVAEIGVQVVGVRDIQYGKKIVLRCEQREAEINVFCGKRGFNVVQSPRRGTSSELNAMMGEYISQCIYDLAG